MFWGESPLHLFEFPPKSDLLIDICSYFLGCLRPQSLKLLMILHSHLDDIILLTL